MSTHCYSHKYLFGIAIRMAFLVCLMAPAYAQESVQVLAENHSRKDSSSSSPTAITHSVTAEDANYVIGADDVLAIDVWHEKDLSRALSVRPDGKISLPLVGELLVAGETPLQVQDSITQRLKEYMENPQVTVMVQETKSQKFNVVGEVQRPGSFVFGHPVTVLDAIALAGGFRDFAKTRKMYVIRTAPDGTRQRLRVNYNDVLKGKKSAENLVLHSHDTVVVP